jgi:hypothetical protein
MHTIKKTTHLLMCLRWTLILAFLPPLSISAFGQSAKSKFSKKTVQFGGSIGLDYGRWRFEYSDWDENGLATELGSLESNKGVGVTLGVQANLNVNTTWSLRIQPQMSFSQKQMVYSFINKSVKQFDHQLTGIEVPIDAIYRFFPKKISPVILFGAWWRGNLGADRVPEIQFSKSEMGMNMGFGLEFNRKKYVFRPELLVSVGLKNGLVSEKIFNTANSIEAIYRDRVSLKLNIMK